MGSALPPWLPQPQPLPPLHRLPLPQVQQRRRLMQTPLGLPSRHCCCKPWEIWLRTSHPRHQKCRSRHWAILRNRISLYEIRRFPFVRVPRREQPSRPAHLQATTPTRVLLATIMTLSPPPTKETRNNKEKKKGKLLQHHYHDNNKHI